MDNIQFGDIDFSATNRSRKKTCSKCKSAEHTIVSCPLNPCGHCKILGHISSSCPIKKQESYARKRLRQLADNMSLEQVEQHNVRNRRESMNPIQIQRQRENDLAENMSLEQVEQHIILLY